METELVLFIPAEHAARLIPGILEAAAGLAETRRERPVARLNLAGLRCLNLSLSGSGEHVRMPVVYPFLRTDGCNFAPREMEPHEITGPDWLVLGGDKKDLGRFVAQAITARLRRGERPLVRLTPYASLRGPLPQEPGPGDAFFTYQKGSENFNQPIWADALGKLRELPEERWHEVGISNTADLAHVFDEALHRLAPKSPRLILDLGCGLGQITRTLAQRYPKAEVVGLDSSAEAVSVAQNAFRLPNLRFLAVDFAQPLPFHRGGVDLIVSTNALPYAPDQLGTARELFGLLTPEGLLLNHCRAEESHLFWDFPKSLALPTNSQIFLSDWFATAGEAGLWTEVLSVPLGMTALYFLPSQIQRFAEPLNAYADAHRHDEAGAYAPWRSHVLLAHSVHARPAKQGILPLEANHLRRLGRVLNTVTAAPPEIQGAAILAWFCNAKMLGLLPDALEFFGAVLPESAEVLRPVLGAPM